MLNTQEVISMCDREGLGRITPQFLSRARSMGILSGARIKSKLRLSFPDYTIDRIRLVLSLMRDY